jgi:hypothetical protein
LLERNTLLEYRLKENVDFNVLKLALAISAPTFNRTFMAGVINDNQNPRSVSTM